MTLFSPSITESDVFTAYTTFLSTLVPSLGLDHIIKGQGNRTPPPPEPEYIVITPGPRMRLATDDYCPNPSNEVDGPTIDFDQSTQVSIQTDVHGDSSADTAQLITTVFRSEYGISLFPAGITPLYTDDPQQLPFEEAEGQTEERWTFAVYLQISPIISTPAQFATTLTPHTKPPADSGN